MVKLIKAAFILKSIHHLAGSGVLRAQLPGGHPGVHGHFNGAADLLGLDPQSQVPDAGVAGGQRPADGLPRAGLLLHATGDHLVIKKPEIKFFALFSSTTRSVTL